jgi:DNA-binding NarL/FixJ family response regulator
MNEHRERLMKNTERDAHICFLYSEGHTQEALAEKFEISEQRVGQILSKMGLTKKDRLSSERTLFTGVHLTVAVKEALRIEAEREGTSMSALIAQAVVAELQRRNIEIVEPSFLDVEIPLPFEG